MKKVLFQKMNVDICQRMSEIYATNDWPFGVAQPQARFSCETIKSDNSF